MKVKVALLSAVTVVLFAFMLIPSVAAYSGQIVCLTPSSCSTSQTINVGGPGDTATATFLLTSNAPSGTSVNYYVCLQSQTACSSNTGTSSGWSWTFTPASGTTGTGGSCTATSCEGNGVGSPSALSLSITAPPAVNSSNSQLSLTIYACSQSGTQPQCNSILTEVASLSVTASVPEFGLGLGLAMAIGILGLLLVIRKRSLNVPQVPMTL